MEKGFGLDLHEEFSTIDFNSKRLEQRFVKTMETLTSQINQYGFAVKTGQKPKQFTGSWQMTNSIGKKSYEPIGKRQYGGCCNPKKRF